MNKFVTFEYNRAWSLIGGMWNKGINNLEEDTLYIKTVLQAWITECTNKLK